MRDAALWSRIRAGSLASLGAGHRSLRLVTRDLEQAPAPPILRSLRTGLVVVLTAEEKAK
jgi:hypothetical protein